MKYFLKMIKKFLMIKELEIIRPEYFLRKEILPKGFIYPNSFVEFAKEDKDREYDLDPGLISIRN